MHYQTATDKELEERKEVLQRQIQAINNEQARRYREKQAEMNRQRSEWLHANQDRTRLA